MLGPIRLPEDTLLFLHFLYALLALYGLYALHGAGFGVGLLVVIPLEYSLEVFPKVMLLFHIGTVLSPPH
jgi:hypothetical protein